MWKKSHKSRVLISYWAYEIQSLLSIEVVRLNIKYIMSSLLSQEEIDAKIAEAMVEASILSQSSKRKADDSIYHSDQEDDVDKIVVTGDEFLDAYNKYELDFINDEWQPNSSKNTAEKPKKSTTTSTKTSTLATITKSTASKATTGATTKTTNQQKNRRC